MPRVPLTDAQRQEYRLDDLCKSVIENIEIKFMVKGKLTRKQTAEALSISANTWNNWRTRGLGGFRDVAKALDTAGYRLVIEPKN